jgi:hypothetical protein
MRTQGMGFVYRPKWTDKKTSEVKTSPTWWLLG